MKRNREGTKGEVAFREHYRVLFGSRWDALEIALSCESASTPYSIAGEAPYFLDAASIAAAEFLPLPGGEILDACAAPGGKALVIASRMGVDDRLIANELSSDRRRRLSTVLDHHLPPELRSRVRVAGEDAGSMCLRNAGRFSSILLDVPCSSERHVLNDPHALAAWTRSRPRSLARRQWTLLASAFLMLRPGGWLLYSTCALGAEENEKVVERLKLKYPESIIIDAPRGDGWEARQYGAIILPDSAGAGPLYVARVKKK